MLRTWLPADSRPTILSGSGGLSVLQPNAGVCSASDKGMLDAKGAVKLAPDLDMSFKRCAVWLLVQIVRHISTIKTVREHCHSLWKAQDLG